MLCWIFVAGKLSWSHFPGIGSKVVVAGFPCIAENFAGIGSKVIVAGFSCIAERKHQVLLESLVCWNFGLLEF